MMNPLPIRSSYETCLAPPTMVTRCHVQFFMATTASKFFGGKVMKVIKVFVCEWDILVELILETVWVRTTKVYKNITSINRSRKRMVLNVSKPNYFGGGLLLYQSLAKDPFFKKISWSQEWWYSFKSKEHEFKHCQLYMNRWSDWIGRKYKWANNISDSHRNWYT